MAAQQAVFIDAAFAPNAQTTLYTSTGLISQIDKCTVTNISASPATISINLVPSGGAAANTNLVLKTKNLLAGETYICPELVGQTLKAGDFVSVVASAASAIVIRMNGRQLS